MQEDFREILINSAVAPSSDINWGAVPQGAAYPQIVLTVVDLVSQNTMQGPDGLLQGRVQVDCYANSYGQATLLSRAVRATLDGYRQAPFQGVFWAGTRDLRESGSNEPDHPFRVSLDFMVNWRETP